VHDTPAHGFATQLPPRQLWPVAQTTPLHRSTAGVTHEKVHVYPVGQIALHGSVFTQLPFEQYSPA
jgi:hypothetical protein